MKKTIHIFLLYLLLIFPVSSDCHASLNRGLFVSVIQQPPVLSSRQAIDGLIDFAKKSQCRILFVQIYRENKAWFPSRVADASPYRECLKNVSEDPFALLIKKAHAQGIQVHAWLNLLSLNENTQARLLKKYGVRILTKKPGKKITLEDYKIDNQYFLEPGDPRVRRELLRIVEEVLRSYPDLDGLQFDYLRYPDKNPFYGYTEANVKRFRQATGHQKTEESDPLWKDWRRRQVTEFLERLVKKARALRPAIVLSTTGCAPYSRAYHEAFQDWPSWLRRNLVDFVTVMSYAPNAADFESEILDAKKRVADFKKVNIGVGAYKLVRAPGIFKREWQLCEKSGCGACVTFHYGSLLENRMLADSLTGGGNSDPS